MPNAPKPQSQSDAVASGILKAIFAVVAFASLAAGLLAILSSGD